MLGDIIGGLISAGSSLIQGSQNRQQQRELQQLNLAQQREFAQQGIRWRVDDARAAGVHPLFALGANTTSFTNLAGGEADNSIASAGQNIGRAVQAAMTADDREKVAAADALTLEKAGLENELLRTQIGALKQSQLGPAMPGLKKKGALDGQGDARKYNLAHDAPLHARPSETQAKDLEDEYGDESIINFLNNNYRQIRDLIESGRAQNLQFWGGRSLLQQAVEYIRSHRGGIPFSQAHRYRGRR